MKISERSRVRKMLLYFFFFFQAEDGIRDLYVTGVQTCALPIWESLRKSRIPGRIWGILKNGGWGAVREGYSIPRGRTPVRPLANPCLIERLEIGRASCRERV